MQLATPDTLALLGKAVEIAVLGVLVWIAKTTHANSRELLSLRIVLTGEKGDNGIKGDVGALRRWRHEEMVPAQQTNLLRLQRLEDHNRLRPLEGE